jgi:uncharacterized protein YceK
MNRLILLLGVSAIIAISGCTSFQQITDPCESAYQECILAHGCDKLSSSEMHDVCASPCIMNLTECRNVPQIVAANKANCYDSLNSMLVQKGTNVINMQNAYSDDNLKGIIETTTNRQVVSMFTAVYNGRDYVISMTIPKGMTAAGMSNDEVMKNGEICSSTHEAFCECMKLSELNNIEK